MPTIDPDQPQRRGTGDEAPPRMTKDQKLRARGYRIYSRPKDGEPIWIDHHRKLWKQSRIAL